MTSEQASQYEQMIAAQRDAEKRKQAQEVAARTQAVTNLKAKEGERVYTPAGA